LTHAWFVHGDAVPHIPFEQVSTPVVPEHCVAVPVHAPEHMPLVHPPVQVTAAPHWPLEPHVSTPPPMHVVAPGLHTAPPSDAPS
jgi:hypothetical protein